MLNWVFGVKYNAVLASTKAYNRTGLSSWPIGRYICALPGLCARVTIFGISEVPIDLFDDTGSKISCTCCMSEHGHIRQGEYLAQRPLPPPTTFVVEPSMFMPKASNKDPLTLLQDWN